MPNKTFKQFFEGCGMYHSDEESPEIRDLGWMNGWYDRKPQEYLDHIENCCEVVDAGVDPNTGGRRTRPKCPMTHDRISMHVDQYTCQKCGIRYKVDSSG